jgi:hypothetical protein
MAKCQSQHEYSTYHGGEKIFQAHQRFLGLVGKWADPDGTAMSGQPVTEPEQAPELHPLTKISLISKRTHGSRIRY